MCSFAIHILSLKTSLSHLLPVVDKYNRRSMECIEWAAFYTLPLGHQTSLWPWVKNIKYAVKTFPKWQIIHQKAPWGVLIKFVLYCFIADCYYNFHSSTKINRIRIFFTTPTLQIGPSVQISFEATAHVQKDASKPLKHYFRSHSHLSFKGKGGNDITCLFIDVTGIALHMGWMVPFGNELQH